MSYEEAFNLNIGDKVIVISTKEERTVEAIRGTTVHLFILLDNGRDYSHEQLKRGTT